MFNPLNYNKRVKKEFDFKSLINPNGHGPSKSDVADIMSRQTGCTFETALNKLNMVKLSPLKK